LGRQHRLAIAAREVNSSEIIGNAFPLTSTNVTVDILSRTCQCGLSSPLSTTAVATLFTETLADPFKVLVVCVGYGDELDATSVESTWKCVNTRVSRREGVVGRQAARLSLLVKWTVPLITSCQSEQDVLGSDRDRKSSSSLYRTRTRRQNKLSNRRVYANVADVTCNVALAVSVTVTVSGCTD